MEKIASEDFVCFHWARNLVIICRWIFEETRHTVSVAELSRFSSLLTTKLT